jgi:hypothetical protein
MKNGHLLFLTLLSCLSLLLTANPQSRTKARAAASQTGASSSAPAAPFAVCQGTFALCTKATCKPVIRKTAGSEEEVGFSCACSVQVGYSVGQNVPKKNPCQSVPTAAPSVGQEVPSRYSPIKSYVACTNKRPWAWCLDARCKVTSVDPNNPSTGTATCACGIATGAPYVYVPADGQYSQTGCTKEYISSATTDDVYQVTEFLTTPAGANLPPSLPTMLTPPPTPAPTPAPASSRKPAH